MQYNGSPKCAKRPRLVHDFNACWSRYYTYMEEHHSRNHLGVDTKAF